MHAHEIVTLGAIAAGGFACSWLAWRLKLPAILFLLTAGILAGPVFGLLHPDELFGDLLTPIVSLAVAIILFEGSLTLKLSEIRGHGSVVRNLVTVGVLVTWLCSALAVWWVLDWDPLLAALFGAIVTVSGPTVVMPLLRAVRPNANVSSVLRWESILIDPLGAILALIVFDVIVALNTNDTLLHVAQIVGVIVATGFLLGALGGWLYGQLLKRRLLPDLLRDYSALAAVLAVFAAAEAVQGESGFLAVTVMGIWLANMRGVNIDDILEFKESLTLLLIGGLFIILASKLDIDALLAIGPGVVLVVVILQFVAGPIRAWISALGSPLNWREILFVGWVFPRGIVAAAVSSLFALRLRDSGYPGAELLVPLVFSVIVGTVVIQSLSTRLLARLLGVAEPEPEGVLVVGANPFGRLVAAAIQDSGKQVRITDSHWASIRRARMLGLPVFYGSPVSGYAENELDLAGLGNLFAASRQPGLNELSCVRFASDFGRDHVFTTNTRRDSGHEKHSVTGELSGRVLYGDEYTVEDLVALVRGGASAKRTALSAEFDYPAYRAQYPQALLLFAIDKTGRLRFPAADDVFLPEPGWSITAMLPPESG
ncbi:MAG: sodium:proton antiporter [Pseudomonadota bacterium]